MKTILSSVTRVTIVGLAFWFVVCLWNGFWNMEISSGQYITLDYMLHRNPELKEQTKKFFADGKISLREYWEIDTLDNRLTIQKTLSD